MPYIGQCFYHGCKDRPGHYLFREDGVRAYNLPDLFPVLPAALDSGFLPPRLPQEEGLASLAHVAGWTVLAFWDRSVDSRQGCNSAFVIPGTHEFHDARRIAQERFPWVWKRFSFEVRLRV